MEEIMTKTHKTKIQLYGRLYRVPSVSLRVTQPYNGIPMHIGISIISSIFELWGMLKGYDL